jgi:UDPglucose 6-dehydrogenase
MGKDNRIGAKFLHPGPGYGGSCFPKDTKALAKIGRDRDEPLSLVETTIAANERQKQRQIAKIEAGLGGAGSLEGKTIAILGLAFKPNTDDMRESPAITICEGLAAKGARLRLWDPEAMNEALRRLGSVKDSIYRARDEYDAIKGAHALVLLTEWNQFRNLDLRKIKELLELPLFFDLRNVYKREEAFHAGLNYFGIGT